MGRKKDKKHKNIALQKLSLAFCCIVLIVPASAFALTRQDINGSWKQVDAFCTGPCSGGDEGLDIFRDNNGNIEHIRNDGMTLETGLKKQECKQFEIANVSVTNGRRYFSEPSASHPSFVKKPKVASLLNEAKGDVLTFRLYCESASGWNYVLVSRSRMIMWIDDRIVIDYRRVE